MKISYKNYLPYETKELEYYLFNMAKRGYILNKICGNILIFSKKTKPFTYCVLGSEIHGDLEKKNSELLQSGWRLIGQNGKMAIFVTDNSKKLLQEDDMYFNVKKCMKHHVAIQAIYIMAAVMVWIFRVILLQHTEFVLDSFPAVIFLLGTFVLLVTLLYFTAEIHNVFGVHSTSGERAPFSRHLFTIGDVGVFMMLLFLIVLSVSSVIFHATLEEKLRITALWILWPFGSLIGLNRHCDFICALAWIAVLTYCVS